MEFLLGVVVGFIFGIFIYWAPLGQFFNELKAIFSLVRRQYRKGDIVKIKSGVDLKAKNPQVQTITTTQPQEFEIWNDMGVDWIHTHSGWKRARILHVFQCGNSSKIEDVYICSHLDLIN